MTSHMTLHVRVNQIGVSIKYLLQTHLGAQKDLVLGKSFKFWELKSQAGNDIYHILVNGALLCCIFMSPLQ